MYNMYVPVQASKFTIGESKYLIHSKEHNEIMKIILYSTINY